MSSERMPRPCRGCSGRSLNEAYEGQQQVGWLHGMWEPSAIHNNQQVKGASQLPQLKGVHHQAALNGNYQPLFVGSSVAT